ncbi:MAG: hypothetical protein OZ935_00980 [Pseudomonadota bacterium]|nr:hypothetical protein [Pseudomonadota bacterium]
MQWRFIRDGVLHLAPTRADEARIDWRPAWQSDANEDSFFLQDGTGRLVGERHVAAGESRGSQTWPLAVDAGHHRLEITGYSFRNFEVRHAGTTAAVFEPAKVHVSADVPAGLVLYFSVPGGARATLNARRDDGVRGMFATRESDGERVGLEMGRHREYSRFDSVALPESATREVWRLEMRGGGKLAFWLDGVPNLFAQRPGDLFEPLMEAGRVDLVVDPAMQKGAAPLLGLAMPYVPIPPHAKPELTALSIRTGSFYSFIDVLNSDPGRERAVREPYRGELAFASDVTILARSGRRAVLTADEPALRAVDAWIDAMADLGGSTVHYLALADEPNLNYPDYDSFEKYFVRIAKRVREHPRSADGRVRIIAPVSSRFADGPTRENAKGRQGVEWARRLLRDHRDLVDAIGWHWWQHRDLLDVRSIRRDIRAAADLAGRDADGRPRIPLIISQTNISSGSALSPYDQDTDFAALWWAGVAVNSALDGLLESLIWFKAADDEHYPKGMFRTRADGSLERKPVGDAMEFIGKYWGGRVLALQNGSFDVDAVAMAGRHGTTVLGVNKAGRSQRLQVDMRGSSRTGMMRIDILDFEHDRPRLLSRCQGVGDSLDLPPRSIFAILRVDGDSDSVKQHDRCPN